MHIFVEQGDRRMELLTVLLRRKGYAAFARKGIPTGPACVILSPAADGGKLCRAADELAAGSLLIGCRSGAAIYAKAQEKGVHYIDLSEDEAYAVENAVPTAEGAVQLLMEHTDRVLRGMPVLILGFGRIGKMTALLLNGIGADVHVAARSAKDRAWAGGLKVSGMEALDAQLASCEAVINTVPARLLDEERLQKMPPGRILLELASAPYGFDAAEAALAGHIVLNGSGLPGKTAPRTAAESLLRAVLRALEGRMEPEGSNE